MAVIAKHYCDNEYFSIVIGVNCGEMKLTVKMLPLVE